MTLVLRLNREFRRWEIIVTYDTVYKLTGLGFTPELTFDGHTFYYPLYFPVGLFIVVAEQAGFSVEISI